MPVRNSSDRVRKYDLSVIPDVVQTKFANLKDFMVDQQQAKQALIVSMENTVGSILDDNGITGNLRIAYLNFARRVWHSTQRFTGAALQKIVAAEKAKYAALGLDTNVLDAIAAAVAGTTGY